MQHISIVVLVFGALAAAIPFPNEVVEVPEQQVVVHSVPPQVVITGAVPVTLEEVLKNAKLVDVETEATPAEDRMGGGGGGSGWGGLADMGLGRLMKKMKRFMGGGEEEPPHHGWGQPSIQGPFAFQLGAYYNPYIPMPIAAPLPLPIEPVAPVTYTAPPACGACGGGYGQPAAAPY